MKNHYISNNIFYWDFANNCVEYCFQAEKVLPHFMQLPLVWVLTGVVLFTLAFMAIYCEWKRLRCFNCIALLIFLAIVAMQLLVIHIAKIYPITDCFTASVKASYMKVIIKYKKNGFKMFVKYDANCTYNGTYPSEEEGYPRLLSAKEIRNGKIVFTDLNGDGRKECIMNAMLLLSNDIPALKR